MLHKTIYILTGWRETFNGEQSENIRAFESRAEAHELWNRLDEHLKLKPTHIKGQSFRDEVNALNRWRQTHPLPDHDDCTGFGIESIILSIRQEDKDNDTI
jgi:hypothetical protein